MNIWLNYTSLIEPSIFDSSGTSSTLSPTEKVFLQIISRVCSGFSLVGLVLVHVVFWFFKSIRTFSLELVAYLCFSSIIFNISNFIPVYETDDISSYHNEKLSNSCLIQAFMNITGDMSSMIWTLILGYTAFISVINQNSLETKKNYFRIGFILIGYLLPLSYAIIVLLTYTYGPSGIFCWIATQAQTGLVKILTTVYYAITWVIIILNCYFVFRVIVLIKQELQNESDLIKKYTSKLKMYPIVQIVSFIPATINRVYSLVFNEENFYLMLIQCIFDSLTGLLFSFVYGYNSAVRNSLKECFQTLFKKKSRSNSVNDTESSYSQIGGRFQNRTSRNLNNLDDTILTD